MTSSRFRLVLLSLLTFSLAALAFTGCEASFSTGGNSVDSDDAADTIKQQYGQKTGGSLSEITCGSADAETGATFTCNAVTEAEVDLDIGATITSVNSDSDGVRFRWDITEARARGVAYAEPAVKSLQSQGQSIVSMECPDDIVIQSGTMVECDATMSDDSRRKAQLTLTDGKGGFNVKLESVAGSVS